MILHVTKAKYLENFKIELSFNDGKTGIVDLSDSLDGPVFEVLKEKSEFSKLKLDDELHTIQWPNGVDLAPEYLYFKAFRNQSDLQKRFKDWGYI
ncbi:MAG: DUF2442 domain-containing protein [Proteobacteria bacterium]|nr:DUF2442 domain-containing protein [Pseudomonadota bacterium]